MIIGFIFDAEKTHLVEFFRHVLKIQEALWAESTKGESLGKLTENPFFTNFMISLSLAFLSSGYVLCQLPKGIVAK
jgi:hypothetical protein